MEIKKTTVLVRDLVDGYRDNDEEGVVGYHGKLDIRPKYQREFVYDEKQEKAVIDTISKGYPLNVMYWVVKEDGTFEVMDGQQRTLSICKYFSGECPARCAMQAASGKNGQLFLPCVRFRRMRCPVPINMHCGWRCRCSDIPMRCRCGSS